MISIVVCSRNRDQAEKLHSNIRESIGVEFEFVCIRNEENRFTIFQAYNLGIKKSKFEYIIFIHEDVKILSPNWGSRLIQHLSKSGTGFIGVAGAKYFPRSPASWWNLPSFNPAFANVIGDADNRKEHLLSKPEDYLYEDNRVEVSFLDGVFLAARKEVFHVISFDEKTFHGFHCYDLDICMQALQAGLSNYVDYFLQLSHFSWGKINDDWIDNSTAFALKWKRLLPIANERWKKARRAEYNLACIIEFILIMKRNKYSSKRIHWVVKEFFDPYDLTLDKKYFYLLFHRLMIF